MVPRTCRGVQHKAFQIEHMVSFDCVWTNRKYILVTHDLSVHITCRYQVYSTVDSSLGLLSGMLKGRDTQLGPSLTTNGGIKRRSKAVLARL